MNIMIITVSSPKVNMTLDSLAFYCRVRARSIQAYMRSERPRRTGLPGRFGPFGRSRPLWWAWPFGRSRPLGWAWPFGRSRPLWWAWPFRRSGPLWWVWPFEAHSKLFQAFSFVAEIFGVFKAFSQFHQAFLGEKKQSNSTADSPAVCYRCKTITMQLGIRPASPLPQSEVMSQIGESGQRDRHLKCSCDAFRNGKTSTIAVPAFENLTREKY